MNRSSYSMSSGGPGSKFTSNYSTYSTNNAFSSSSSSTTPSVNWKSNNNAVIYSGSGEEIFEKITNAENAKGFKDQDYNKLKESCRKSGRLFEDQAFPADDRSLFFSQPSPRRFVWKRPGVCTQYFCLYLYQFKTEFLIREFQFSNGLKLKDLAPK